MKVIVKNGIYKCYINGVLEVECDNRSEFETWLLNIYSPMSTLDRDPEEVTMKQINDALS